MKSLSVVRVVGRELSFILAFIVLFTLAGLAGYASQGTQTQGHLAVIQMDTDALTKSATTIIIGDVRSQSSRSSTTEGIVTDSTISVVERLKGTPAPQVVVTTRGGQLGNLVSRTSDEAALQAGRRVMLFLIEQPTGRLLVVGGFQGTYEIRGPNAFSERRIVALTTLIEEVRRAL